MRGGGEGFGGTHPPGGGRKSRGPGVGYRPLIEAWCGGEGRAAGDPNPLAQPNIGISVQPPSGPHGPSLQESLKVVGGSVRFLGQPPIPCEEEQTAVGQWGERQIYNITFLF